MSNVVDFTDAERRGLWLVQSQTLNLDVGPWTLDIGLAPASMAAISIFNFKSKRPTVDGIKDSFPANAALHLGTSLLLQSFRQPGKPQASDLHAAIGTVKSEGEVKNRNPGPL